MDRVVADGELAGLAEMIAGLLRGNLDAHPRLGAILAGARGTVTIRVPDVEETVGLSFGDGVVRVRTAPFPRASVEIVADSDAMMSFSTVPLRFGLPDLTKQEGRALTKDILTRRVKVRGMVTHLGLVRRLQELMTVT